MYKKNIVRLTDLAFDIMFLRIGVMAQNYFLMLFRRQNYSIRLFCYIKLPETLFSINPRFYKYWLVVKALIFHGGLARGCNVRGSNPWWGQVILSIPVRTGHGAHPASSLMGNRCGFPGGGGKVAKAWPWPPHPIYRWGWKWTEL